MKTVRTIFLFFSAYDKQGKIIWETDVEGSSNSNYSLNQKEELVVNLLSSPQTSTVYCTIRIDGEKTTYPAIPDLTSCFTYPYPLGGTLPKALPAATTINGTSAA